MCQLWAEWKCRAAGHDLTSYPALWHFVIQFFFLLLTSLNQSKVGTDILGDIKEVYNDIVTTSKNVALDPNSAYLFVSWQNVSGKVNQPCEILLLTGTSTVTQVTLYGTPLNIWKMLPTSGLTQGIYAKDGYYNYAKIIKL